MRKHIISGIIITIAFIILIPRETKAVTYDEAIKIAYEELITKGRNTVTFESDDSSILSLKFIEDLVSIDNEDTLYDGIALDVRGTEHIKRQGNKYTVSIDRAYNVEDADRLTDEMVTEIRENLPENPTDREIFNGIRKYIRKTYSYDFEAAYIDETKISNFVDAYYGDRKIICSGYATVTYLLANKMGLDCRLYLGNEHVYNGIRFNGDKDYTLVDLSSPFYPAGFVPVVAELVPQFNGAGKNKEKITKLNSTSSKRYASITDICKGLF